MHLQAHIAPRHRVAGAALVAATMLLVAAPAHATQPTTTTEQRHVVLPIADCGSFTAILTADVTREFTIFYDQDGVPVRDVLARRQQSTISNSVTGKSADNSGVWRVTRTYTDGQLDGTAIQVGRADTVTIPGLGVLFQQEGRGIQENGLTVVFEAGPHDFDDNIFTELCDYLAG